MECRGAGAQQDPPGPLPAGIHHSHRLLMAKQSLQHGVGDSRQLLPRSLLSISIQL